MTYPRKMFVLAIACCIIPVFFAACASVPAGASSEEDLLMQSAEFSLGTERGQRQVIDFDVNATGQIKATAEWKGASSGLSLILNGPGKTGAYQRVDGPSSLSLSQTITPEILALGTAWKISIVCWDTDKSVAGALTVKYPKGAPVTLGAELLINGGFDQGLQGWGNYTANGGAAVFTADNGTAVVKITAQGKTSSDIQLNQGNPGFAIQKGRTYRLELEASSSGSGAISITISENGNDINKDGFAWSSHAVAPFTLGAGTSVYKQDLTVQSDNPRASILILLGKASGEVRFGRISIREVSRTP